jgi:HEAT repeat protein
MDIKQKSLDAFIILNTIIKNMRLYPPSSARVADAIARLHQYFLEMLKTEKSLIFSQSEKRILIGGEPLSEQDQGKWQVAAFLKIFFEFGIQSITFDKGLEKDELSSFLEILSKKAEVLKGEGGLPRMMKEKNLAHIELNKKTTAAAKKNQQIPSGDNVVGDQVIHPMMRADPEAAGNPEGRQENAGDPDFLLLIFQSGLVKLLEQKDNLSKIQISENLVKMISILDKAARSLEKKDQDKISQQISKSVTVLDSDIVLHLKAQKIDQYFGGALAKYFASEIAGEKAVKAPVPEEVPVKTQIPESTTARGKTSYQNQNLNLKAPVPEEVPVKTPIPESTTAPEKTSYQNQILNLKEALRYLTNDYEKAFLDTPLMLALPKLFEQLDAQKDHETMGIVISRLIGNLLSKNADVRFQASTALADICAGLSHERRNKLIEKLSARLIDWIKMEPLATIPYKKICNHLQDLVHAFILEGRFAEALPILDVFINISAGILEKNDKAHEISSDIIRTLASQEHLNILFKAFNTNNPSKQAESGGVLVRLGDVARNRLLDILRDKADSDDRVRIMKLFIGIGKAAIPVIRDRIGKTAPWYYLRNLAYILGYIGNESSASTFQPLLLHENNRLRSEALKGIYRTGGKERGAILLSALPLADDRFKLNIIETLGNIKCVEAVPELLHMLKKRQSVDQSLRADQEEIICAALGSIGSPEALPALSKIAKSTSFFLISPYAEKVKVAAGIAVVSIRKKQEEIAEAMKATETAQEAKVAEAVGEDKVSI